MLAYTKDIRYSFAYTSHEQIMSRYNTVCSWLFEYKRAIINSTSRVVFISWPMTRLTTEHRRERLVTLGWSETIGRYNTPDTMVDIGPKK